MPDVGSIWKVRLGISVQSSLQFRVGPLTLPLVWSLEMSQGASTVRMRWQSKSDAHMVAEFWNCYHSWHVQAHTSWQKCVEDNGFCGKCIEHLHLLSMVLIFVHVPLFKYNIKMLITFSMTPVQLITCVKYLFTHPCAQFPLVWTTIMLNF